MQYSGRLKEEAPKVAKIVVCLEVKRIVNFSSYLMDECNVENNGN